MPNYSLLINSQFKPYSFEELIKPYQIYGEAYKEMEGAYNTLGTTAGALESVLNDERDPVASNLYKNYMQGLNNAADELATKGLSPSARTNINNLTKQYATSIVPIQKAAETWQKQIEEQRKNGDSKINSYNANTLSIDKFLENPQLSYDTIDKGNLMKTSTAYFSQMAKQARDIQAKKLYDKSGKYTYERDFVEEYGATPEEVIAFQNDMERALQTGDANAVQYVIALHPELGNIADKVFKSTKAANWDPNSEGVAETWNTIIGSSVAAMGETKHNLRQDAAGLKWLDYSIKKQAAKDADVKQPVIGPYNSILSGRGSTTTQSKEQSAMQKKINRFLELQNSFKGNDGLQYFALIGSEYTDKNGKLVSKADIQNRLNQTQYGLQNLKSKKNPTTEELNRINKFENDIKRYRTFVNNYNKYQNGYNSAVEYKNLEQELMKVALENNPNESAYSTVSLDWGNKSVVFDTNLSNAIKGVADKHVGYNFNVTESTMKNIARRVKNNVDINANPKAYNKFIITEKGENIKNNLLADKDSGIDFDNLNIYFEDGVRKFNSKGKTYILKPGALGDLDEAPIYQDYNGNGGYSYADIERIFKEGNYTLYKQLLDDYANTVYEAITSEYQAQPQTSSKLNYDTLEPIY